VDFGAAVFDIILLVLVVGFFSRKRIRGWIERRRQKTKQAVLQGEVLPPALIEPAVMTAQVYELDKAFAPFGSNAAHASALYSQAQFIEAVSLLAAPGVPFATVMQYVEGNSWSLASAALAALRKRPDRGEATDRVLAQCEHYAPWTMYFALELLAEAEPRVPVGVPIARAKDWWIDNRWMPNIFRDYLDRCAAQGDVTTFGDALMASGASPHDVIRRFLLRVTHPSAAVLIKELDDRRPSAAPAAPGPDPLKAIGRYWSTEAGLDVLIEPDGWRKAFALAEATLRQDPPRSLLVSGESLVGKSSFLVLLARRIESDGWSVFEASGADLQADQIYIGQLEGRIRQLVEELGKRHRVVWYIPDIVQVAMSGRHLGQSATMLDQIIPAIAAGRLVIWAEATPKGTARLVQLKPSLRGLFETVTIDPLSPQETLALARDVIAGLAEHEDVHFEADCAEVALDSAGQYLGTGGLPGSAILMLKLTAVRAEARDQEITAHRVLETLSQLSGLPISILDTKEQLDLAAIRQFFTAKVIGQEEAVDAMVERIAMLKAGLNDPGKPIGVFLFAGPTGTGKTELAKAVTQFLFGSVERLIRLDMSEFQTHESISKILGQSSAPAMIEADSLVSRVRKQPFSVLLLDEFEKSHPMIWDLFLQAFDEGRLTDAMGQVADLRHCLIVLTSNLGATAHRSAGLGFAPAADVFTKDQVLRAISQTYRPEFQNRLDKVIVFKPLTRDLMRGILKKELAALVDRRGLKDRAWAIEWEPSALEFLLERGFSPEMGARPLKRAIDQYVVAPLASIIVEKRFPQGEQFLFVRSDGEGIQAEFVDPDEDAVTESAAPSVGPAEAASPSALAAAILAPQGTPAEFQMLQGEYDDLERKLGSSQWEDLKQKLADEMSLADFWNRDDRFRTLARFALMDRVKTAAETASGLRQRLLRRTQSPHPYSSELSARLALQLRLVAEGIKDAIDDAPIELALVVEPVFDGAGERQATLAWCHRLAAMYRGWANKRRMAVTELQSAQRDSGSPVLVISGFGAYRTLAPEAGLHVFELNEGGMGRVTVRVRLAAVPLGDIPAAKERKTILKALDEAERTSTVVRRYREEPPLVRDGVGKWRTGRLDLVLGGEFDLLQGARE
jgi:ATP-dependent Clp protease ATP-binding subunit ClpC